MTKQNNYTSAIKENALKLSRFCCKYCYYRMETED